MPGSLGTAYVQVIPTTRGIKGNLTKELNDAAGPAGDAAGSRIGGAIKKAVLVAGIGDAIRRSITAGADLEQSLGGVETLYGKHANIIIRNANNAWKNAGVSANDYMQQSTSFAAALLDSLGNDTRKAAKYADMAIMDMSDNANKFGTDISSIQMAYQGFSKQNYTMLDNLKLGFSGTKEGMQELLEKAEKITGKKYDINNLSDVYEAIHAVQTELGVTGTTADEAATTLSGSFMAMKAAATNFLGNLALGKEGSEAVTQSLKSLISSAQTFLFDNFVPAVGNIIKSLPAVISTMISQGIPQMVESGLELMKGIAKGFANSGSMLQNFMPTLQNLSGYLLEKSGDFVRIGTKMLKNLASGISSSLPSLIETIPQIITNIANIINNNVPAILACGVKILVELGKGIILAIPALIKNIPKIFSAFLTAWSAISWGSLGKSAINLVKDAIGNGIKGIGPKIANGLKGVYQKITSPFTRARDGIKKVLNKIKGFFPLRIGKIFSNLKIPKITVSGGKAPFGIAGKGSLPKFNIKWNDKAVNNPYMFSNATLFGAGETKDEILYGRDNLMRDIRKASGGSVDYEKLAAAVVEAIKNIVIVTEVDGKEIARTTAPHLKKELNAIDSRNNRKLGYIK